MLGSTTPETLHWTWLDLKPSGKMNLRVLGRVSAGGGEGELPGGSLFDVGVGLVGGGSSRRDGGGLGEGDSSVLAVLGDDNIFEEGFDDEF